ncbi:MAG TPA: hypothetical protein VMD08_11055 [Candidatus Baltobacteraceae bacterium]|nr:hypothetical protein [Candidatus Baltobacteraceae bacterium]
MTGATLGQVSDPFDPSDGRRKRGVAPLIDPLIPTVMGWDEL